MRIAARADGAFRHPPAADAGAAPPLMLGPQARDGVAGGRVVDGIALVQIAVDAQSPQGADEVARRRTSELPDACAGGRAIPLAERGEILVGLLHQQSRVRGRAAAADLRCFEHNGSVARIGERPGDGRAD